MGFFIGAGNNMKKTLVMIFLAMGLLVPLECRAQTRTAEVDVSVTILPPPRASGDLSESAVEFGLARKGPDQIKPFSNGKRPYRITQKLVGKDPANPQTASKPALPRLVYTLTTL